MAVGFEPKRKLGEGFYGEVWLSYDRGLGIDRAVKLIPPSKVTSPENFFAEAQVLKEVEHPNIVRVEETGRMTDGRLYIAMEYEPGGSLKDKAQGAPLLMRRVIELLCDALRGLQHAHDLGKVHRDIKPANILIGSRGDGKLSDFGLATEMGPGGVASPAGYLYHAAPEIVRHDEASMLTDIYAVGVTLYRLLNGDDYLPSFDENATYERAICQGSFPDRRRYRLYIPRSLRRVVNKAMNLDPAKRYQSAHRLRTALEQVAICCDWREEPTRSGTRWSTATGRRQIIVEMTEHRREDHAVETKKRVSSGNYRRVTDACVGGVTASRARRFAKCVLTDYATGRRK